MACKFCGYDHESTGCPPKPGAWTSMYQMTEDPKEAVKRERNYALLQAAARIYAHSNYYPTAEGEEPTAPDGIALCVTEAIALLAEIESRSK